MGCEICRGKGFLLKEVDGEHVWSMCECQKKRNKDDIFTRKLIDSNIPKEFWGINFDFYKDIPYPPDIKNFNKEQLLLIENFIKNPPVFFKSYRLLWIWGKEDNAGHSSLAAIIGKEYIKHNFKVKFFRMSNLISMFINRQEHNTVFNDISDVDLIILDDALDVNRAPLNEKLSYVSSLLFNLFSDVLSNGVNMICTSNTLLAGVDDRYKELKTLFSRYIYELELRGNIIQYTKNNPNL